MEAVKKIRTPRRAAIELPIGSDDTGLPESLSDAELIAGHRLAARSAISVIADGAMAVEKIRVRAQVRAKHLKRRAGFCPYTAWLHKETMALEQKVDELLARLVGDHPAAPWFSKVKGTGGEAIGKVIGHIEAFGKFYPVGDPMIPAYVTRLPEMVPVPQDDTDELVEIPMVWVSGIERLTTPSKLIKYAGFVPGQKRKAGELTDHNVELRTMCWRLATSLMKASGKYYNFYETYKARTFAQATGKGIKILPTPKGRMCVACNQVVSLKTARFCPSCGGALSLKTEPDGVLYQGHLHQMAMRRMIKLFLCHLWVEWRKALELPGRIPYAIEYLGHSQIISPSDMVDR